MYNPAVLVFTSKPSVYVIGVLNSKFITPVRAIGQAYHTVIKTS